MTRPRDRTALNLRLALLAVALVLPTVSLVLLVCGIYYPVSMLPEPLATLATAIPLTYLLEGFRADFGFPPLFSRPWLRGFALALAYVLGGYACFVWAISRARRTGMLLKLYDLYRPDFVVVATDAPGKTFRDDLYAAYKGTRNTTPDDLIAQIPRVFELVDLFGIPVVGAAGLEADDVIASITHHVPPSRTMNTFAILRRNAWASAEALEKAVGISSRVGLVELHDRVRWIRSYVVRELGGRFGLICIYQSDDIAALREHARLSGMPAD